MTHYENGTKLYLYQRAEMNSCIQAAWEMKGAEQHTDAWKQTLLYGMMITLFPPFPNPVQ